MPVRSFAMAICFGCTTEFAWDTAKKATHREVTCYAESRDGVNWVKQTWDCSSSMARRIAISCSTAWGRIASWRSRTKTQTHDPRHDRGGLRSWPLGKTGLYIYESPDGIRWKMTQSKRSLRRANSIHKTWRFGMPASGSIGSITGYS